MSVVVEDISKQYGSQMALDALSFEVKQGEILGLLGPNGAGKTTTMKILTAFLPPTKGNAYVCGHSIHDDHHALRASIGYLPEHNPLYPEMYVREFLRMVAGIYGMKAPDKRIKEVIELTELGPEQHKKITALSKGYKQRVGLAQAILHDPQVLILDEPISGLDPNQLVEIRKLIKELGKTKTIIFSSHILQEVKALCSRVVILNKGKLVADKQIDQLQGVQKSKKKLSVEFLNSIDPKKLMDILKGAKIATEDNKIVNIEHDSSQDYRPILFDFAVDNSNKILHLSQEQLSVEEIFQTLTSN